MYSKRNVKQRIEGCHQKERGKGATLFLKPDIKRALNSADPKKIRPRSFLSSVVLKKGERDRRKGRSHAFLILNL